MSGSRALAASPTVQVPEIACSPPGRSIALRLGMTRILLLVSVLALGRPAWACGGFFCDRGGQPVAQAGEEILFAVDGSSIEVHVRIRYQGSDAGFAWILPVRKLPTLSVGTDATFVALERATTPTFRVAYQSLGCAAPLGRGAGFGCGATVEEAPASSAGGAGGAGFNVDAATGVDVISHGVVGPYESVVLMADDGGALRAWLVDNGYLLTPAGAALLDPYVTEHDYFVALKLRTDANATDITPIVLSFADGEPCVPLRLTAIAALEDMEVTAYLLGPARAVPTNYAEVELDWARLDWTRPAQSYPGLVSAAADEAGGRAFVTEFADQASALAGALFPPRSFDASRLARARDAAELVTTLNELGFPQTAQVLAVLARFIPEPAAAVADRITPQNFYACLACYARYLAGQPIDAAGATAALEQEIVGPLQHAQELFDRLPYLSRLHTRLSPAEMTADPTFAFNPDLPPVSNQHLAQATLACNDGTNQPIRWSLPDGSAVKTWATWPLVLGGLPAATWPRS
jgi:hypothetical protein